MMATPLKSCCLAYYCVFIVAVIKICSAQTQCPSRLLVGGPAFAGGYCQCSVASDLYNIVCFRINNAQLRTAISAVEADKIASIVVRRSNIPTLPANLFKSMTSLKRLSVINSSLRSLACNFFQSKEDKTMPFSENLEVIDFSFNQLDGSLCSDLFFGPLANVGGEGKLKIDLHYSRITNVPQKLFGGGNDKVAEIDLSWNPLLPDLPDGVFAAMPSLKSLDLSHNQLREFKKEWFSSDGAGGDGGGTEGGGDGSGTTSALESLDLDNNRIRSIRASDFEDFKQLTELDLSDNIIAAIPKNSLPKTLVKLDLGGNRLRTLPSHVFDELAELNELDLSDNPFSSLPLELFANTEALKFLALRNYPQGFLSPQVFGSDGNLQLDTLDLTGARLRPSVQRALLGQAHARRGKLAINVDTSID